MLQTKRAYEEPEETDGYRILVDRLWPRGIKKEALRLDSWEKDIAPSPDLRRQFNHDSGKFEWFKEEYMKELEQNEAAPQFMENVAREAKVRPVTLVYGAKDTTHNHAVILKEFIENKMEKGEKDG
ncbi:DUF488 domain-containing protein [Atopococcus tabaci]|uniref:DUF488 domain-containing protein n=1 Tax=Atopococcus tabaci TaxID=269774 RepID=UPI00240A7A9C|nr:DUF488 family protein [Atopococcus tabaci]